MRKIKWFWQFLIPIVLYFPYLFLFDILFINWFGCSCPKFDTNGDMLANQFNVNDFSRIFWSVVSIIVTVVSIIKSFKIVDNRKRIVYILISILISILLALLCLGATPAAK